MSVTRNVVRREGRGDPESCAAVVILETLCAKLGVRVPVLIVDNEVDRRAAAQALVPLLARPGPELAAAAGRAWTMLYERTLSEGNPLGLAGAG